MPRQYTSSPPENRFWAKVRKTDACWLWTRGRSSMGYGHLRVNGKLMYAHRFSYELHYGAIPTGMFVCHHCDTPSCVRPDHLFVGTPADNMRDKTAKGRTPSGAQSSRRLHPLKLSMDTAQEIRVRYSYGDVSQKELAIRFGIDPSMVSHIIRGVCWNPEDTPRHDIVHSAPETEEHTRAYQSEKLAALEAQIERLARLRRLGYDFDAVTRQDGDRADK